MAEPTYRVTTSPARKAVSESFEFAAGFAVLEAAAAAPGSSAAIAIEIPLLELLVFTGPPEKGPRLVVGQYKLGVRTLGFPSPPPYDVLEVETDGLTYNVIPPNARQYEFSSSTFGGAAAYAVATGVDYDDNLNRI